MMTDTAGTRTRDRPRRRAGGRRGGRHPQGHPPRRGPERGDRRRAGRHAGPGDPGGLRPAARLRPLPRAHSDDRHRGHRLLRGGPGPRPEGRRRADPRGHPSQALPAPPRQVRSDRRLRRRRQSTGRGRRPARGQDRHRPLRTDPGAPGLAPQRDEGPRRRPPADHRPAGHRPRRRAHPLRPPQRRGAHQRPGPHAPRPGHPPPPHRRPRERCAAWPAATGS